MPSNQENATPFEERGGGSEAAIVAPDDPVEIRPAAVKLSVRSNVVI
jgi:hypothetical protein